jgi:phospholipid/cholesterol/gamma-HCH transport system substrate-binding protein
MQGLKDVLDNAEKILSEENQSAIGATLKNIQTLTDTLVAEREAIGALPGNVNETLADVQATIRQIQGMISELQPGIHSTIDNVNQSSQNLASLTGRVDGMLENHEQAIDHFMEEGLAEAPALMKQTRKVLRDLEKMLQDLQDGPSQLIYRHDENSVEIDP